MMKIEDRIVLFNSYLKKSLMVHYQIEGLEKLSDEQWTELIVECLEAAGLKFLNFVPFERKDNEDGR